MIAPADAKRQEERVKLFATALSNVGVATIVAGVVGPSVVGRFQPLVAMSCFLAGFGLHLAAQVVLHYVVASPRRPEPVEAEMAE